MSSCSLANHSWGLGRIPASDSDKSKACILMFQYTIAQSDQLSAVGRVGHVWAGQVAAALIGYFNAC